MAFGVLKDAHEKGVVLSPLVYDHMIRSLLAEGSVDDAMTVKDMWVSRILQHEIHCIDLLKYAWQSLYTIR